MKTFNCSSNQSGHALLGWVFIIYALACLGLAIYLSQYQSPPRAQFSQLPDFSQYQVISDRKNAFFSYLKPIIAQENQVVLNHRDWLKKMQRKLAQGQSLTDWQLEKLTTMADTHKINPSALPQDLIPALLKKIDIIPEAMVLAQAAMESAWGQSRFAQEANNLFGQWCFAKGCGLVPKQRNHGAHHEVAKFDSVSDAIASYIRNINSHRAYAQVRTIRLNQREQGLEPSALEMIKGLGRYSEKGQAYIDELRHMIIGNHLETPTT